MDNMALNSIQAIGDDQRWKSEVERAIQELQRQVAILIRNSQGK